MKKTIIKQTHPIQFLYPNDELNYKFTEDYYEFFETDIEKTHMIFYNRVKSIVKTTNDGGKSFNSQIESENFSYFVCVDKKLNEIIDMVISKNEGKIEII